MNKKRIVCLALCALMTVASLTGCAPGGTAPGGAAPGGAASEGTPGAGEETGPIKLRMWAHWGSEQRRPTIEKMIAGFNEKYKDQNISAEYVYVPFDELETKLIASVAAGNPPDMAITAIESVNVKAMRKQAADITDYLDPSTKDKYYPMYWETALYKDRVFALPFNTDTRMVYYNKAMFTEAGIDVASLKTWDDLFAAGAKIDAALNGKGNFKTSFLPMLGNFGFDAIAATNNAPCWDDPMNPGACTLDSKENVETLEHIKAWNDRYGQTNVQSMIGSNGSGAQDGFISGQVAMMGNVCNYIATLEKYGKDDKGNWIIDYGTFAYPAGPSKGDSEIGSFGGGFVAEVPFGAKNPKAATKLVEYMCGDEAATTWGVEQKDVMCNIKANEAPELSKSIGWDTTVNLLPKTQITRRHPYCPDSATVKDTAINRIAKDFDYSKSSQEILTEAKTLLEKKIADEKAVLGE